MEDQSENAKKSGMSIWGGLIGATSSPLHFFAMVVLVCNSLFGIAAAAAFNERIFIYTLHTFLAVVAAFSMIALWSPRTFYGPSDLAQWAELERRNEDKPLIPLMNKLVPTLVALVVIIVYAIYQSSTP